MNKIITIILLLILFSCSKENDVSPVTKQMLTTEKLIGSWQFYGISVTTHADGKIDYVNSYAVATIPETFYKIEYHSYTFTDGTAIKYDLNRNQIIRSSYRISGNTITLSNGIIFIYNQQDNLATLMLTEETQLTSIKYEYRK